VDGDGTVYFGSEDGALYAVGPDGGLKWFAQTFGGVRSSPLVTEDAVYVGSLDANFYALSKADGSVKWSYAADRDIVASAALGKNGDLYIASVGGTLYSISPQGEIQWRTETGGEIEGSPSVDKDGVIYVGTTSPDRLQGQLYAFDPATGQEKWKLSNLSPISSSPIIGADGTLYVGSGDSLLLVGQQQGPVEERMPGDFNNNGKVDVSDATIALRFAVNLRTPTADDLKIGDVAPKATATTPRGDGRIGIQDATRLLRKAVGLEQGPWP
jgi:outer membrane protein assembly factor BamB